MKEHKRISAKVIDLVVFKAGSVGFMVTAYFKTYPPTLAEALPIIAIGLAIFIIGLPISANVWKDKVIELAKLKHGGAAGDAVPRS